MISRIFDTQLYFYSMIMSYTCNRRTAPEAMVMAHKSLQWRHNDLDCVSNHQPHDCLPNRLFRRRSKKISKLRVTGICAGNSPGTGEFPAQMASYAENVSIWWRHHGLRKWCGVCKGQTSTIIDTDCHNISNVYVYGSQIGPSLFLQMT